MPNYLPYAGVGARKAPRVVCSFMRAIARDLERRGYTLRSGGARGSEIFLPFAGYNGHTSTRFDVDQPAFDLAKRFCAGWDKRSEFAQGCFARNGYQVLGRDLATPSRFVVCWTRGGRDVGGTGHTLRVARAYGIPVFNLYDNDATSKLSRLLGG